MAAQLSLAWRDDDVVHENCLYLHGADASAVRRALGLPSTGLTEGGALGLPAEASPPATFPLDTFIQRPNRWVTVEPGIGRWYPYRLFRADLGPWMSFRVVEVSGQTITVQSGHPLAGFDVAVDVADVDPLAASPAFDEGAIEDKVARWLNDGPGIEAVRADAEPAFFTPDALRREDESDDTRFYAMPRLVQHIDGYCRAALASRYAALAPADPQVLDLMSSWVTHLPESMPLAGLACVGLNAQELSANHRATAAVCKDLNAEPVLPLDDESFDLAICSVSVEYLTELDAMFAEVARVLKPGAAFANGFSERWFPTKIIHIWMTLHPFERLRLVTELYRRCAGFDAPSTWTRHGAPRPPDDEHSVQNPAGDPVYTVWARRH